MGCIPTRDEDAAERQAAALASIAADIHAAAESFSRACKAFETGISKATATERRALKSLRKEVGEVRALVEAHAAEGKKGAK